MRFFADIHRKDPTKRTMNIIIGTMTFGIIIFIFGVLRKDEWEFFLAIQFLFFSICFTLFVLAMPIGWKGLTREKLIDPNWRNRK